LGGSAKNTTFSFKFGKKQSTAISPPSKHNFAFGFYISADPWMWGNSISIFSGKKKIYGKRKKHIEDPMKNLFPFSNILSPQIV